MKKTVGLFVDFVTGTEGTPEEIVRMITVDDIKRINNYYKKTDRTFVASLNSDAEVKVSNPESGYVATLDEETLATLVDNVKKRELKLYNDFMKTVV